MTEKLTKTEKLLLEYFRKFPLNKPITTEQNELAKSLGCSRRSIARAVKSLEEKGYIRKESGKEDGTENKYFLISPASKPPSRKHYVCKNFTRKSNIITKTFIEEIKKAKNLSDFHFAIDKVNSSIWSNKNDISKTEITIPLKAEPDTSKMQVTNNVVLWLDELKNNTAVQRLTQYDLRVYMAIGNLFEVGNTKVSVKDIYKAMGNNNNPAPDQRKRILLAVEKMSSIRITIDTSEEEQAGYNYPNLHIKRRNLLYTKLDIVLKNGQETEAIELMEEPVLFQFALTRNQYTTIPAKLLCSPINKTEATLAIENYLIKRITERGKANGTILLSTVYEKASIIEKKQKQRAKVKIKTLLEYWKEQGFIANYDVCMNDNKSKQEECIKFKR